MVEENGEPRPRYSGDSTTKPVVDLLTAILSEVQKQVQSKTPAPLEGEAVAAVSLFRDIGAILELRPPTKPTVHLTANPSQVGRPGDTTTLTWTSTGTETVSIDN